MQKATRYDWKDSNLALFGSDTEKQVKKDSAMTEKAWSAVGECDQPQLFIWRIEKFQVNEWPKEEYGSFYSGDSYIVLNVYKEDDELKYDVHFWIGKYSTNDEYGTAAYKTVELDTFLDDAAIQHREVQGYESDLFKSYFDTITIMKGGCSTGFRHVKPEEYKPRLLHFKGLRKNVDVIEVKLTRRALNSGDVFILDLGLTAYQWNGQTANKDEKIKAAMYLQQLENDRHGKTKTEVLDERDASTSHKFYENLPDKPYTRPDVKKTVHSDIGSFKKSLFRLSDESGSLNFSLISEGSVPKSMLDDKDVYIVDNGKSMFVYVGKGASASERKNALTYAHKYLMSTLHPLIPISVVKEGQKDKEFNSLLDD